jgi:uncharacterized membrane protein (UPF0127 family)
VTERLINSRDGSIVADSITWARGWRARARGLIGQPPLRSGQALVIVPALQVHTFFMPVPIDVVFCDASWVVLHVLSPLGRRRISRFVRRARFVVELPAGAAAAIAGGDRLSLEGQDPSVL